MLKRTALIIASKTNMTTASLSLYCKWK